MGFVVWRQRAVGDGEVRCVRTITASAATLPAMDASLEGDQLMLE